MRPDDGTDAARWFLDRGLPSVLPARWRRRRLLRQGTPPVAALAAFELVVHLSNALPGIDDDPRSSLDELIAALLACGIVVAMIVGPVLAARAAHRIAADRPASRSLVAVVVLATALVVAPIVGWLVARQPLPVAVLVAWMLCALVVLGVYLGVSAVAWWALRHALAEFGASLQTFGRVLPLLLIVLLVFLTGELWQWAAVVERPRLWNTIGVMAVAGVGFMAVSLRDAVGDVDRARREGYAPDLLADTPFAGDDLASLQSTPLTRPERLNLLIKLLVAQLIQVGVVVSGIFVFFLVLGAVMLPDRVIAGWSGQPVAAGTFLWLEVPVPQALLQMSMLVAAISGLYFAVNTSTDAHYRTQFLDPLVAELGMTLAARDVFLSRQRS